MLKFVNSVASGIYLRMPGLEPFLFPFIAWSWKRIRLGEAERFLRERRRLGGRAAR